MTQYNPGQPGFNRIIALAEADTAFQERLSDKASALLRQIKSKAKHISTLSERDQSTFRQLQRTYNEFTDNGSAEVDEAQAEPVEAHEPVEAQAEHVAAVAEAPAASEDMALQTVEQAIEGEIANQDLLDVMDTDELLALEKLNPREQADLDQIESEIREALPQWENVNDLLGARFAEIKKRKLFRGTHRSFPRYIFETFQVTRAKAYQLMITAEVRAAVTAGDEIEALPSQRAAITVNQITQSIKGLLGADYEESVIENFDRELHKFVWAVTLQSAPQIDGKPHITPAHLESVKETIGHIIQTGTVTVDGQDIPVSGLSTFVDHNITEETHERTQRLREGIVGEVQRGRERQAQPQERNVSISKKSGKKLTNILVLACSEHGTVGVTKFVYGGIVVSCGCTFIKVTDSEELVQTDIIS